MLIHNWRLSCKVRRLKREIAKIEQKRARSQAALVEAILTHTEPCDEDVDYFNMFTAEIEELRTRMHEQEQEKKTGRARKA